jgi:hypothetical protein
LNILSLLAVVVAVDLVVAALVGLELALDLPLLLVRLIRLPLVLVAVLLAHNQTGEQTDLIPYSVPLPLLAAVAVALLVPLMLLEEMAALAVVVAQIVEVHFLLRRVALEIPHQ